MQLCFIYTKKDNMNFISAEEAVSIVKSGERIFIHGGCATPQRLVTVVGRILAHPAPSRKIT